MNTPPDDTGGARPPIASTDPVPTEQPSTETSLVGASGAPTNKNFRARRWKGWLREVSHAALSACDASGENDDEQANKCLACDARRKRLRSKAAYRAHLSADPVFRENERNRAREWRLQNPENRTLYVYDQVSAFPAAMLDFPSLASGEWIKKSGEEIAKGSLGDLRAAVETLSCVSMFKIRYQFPTYETYDPDPRPAVFIPFCPLPYREKRGGILFPSSGYGWYMRDDVLAAIAWLDRFVPDYPRPQSKHHRMAAFEIEEAWIFQSGNEGRANHGPFDFIRDLFLEGRRIKDEADQAGRYDIREKAIKLSLNSIYGKLAQSVGGVFGEPEFREIIETRDAWDQETQSRKITERTLKFRVGDPKIIKSPPTANPYYAAATTAYCRRRLIEAALIDPHAIVFFATDGIVSTRPLNGLARVKKAGDAFDLGDWEYCEADGGLFVMPGVYTYGKIAFDENGARTIKPVTKIRGGDAKKYAAKLKANQWLIDNVLAAWRTPFDPQKPAQFPRIVAPYKKYITVGNALASKHRWKLAGRWTAQPGEEGAGTREINVHSVGNKRELIPDESCWPDYVSVPGREARRCHELIRTLPALNNDRALSRPRMPEWMDKDIGRDVEEREEQEEILWSQDCCSSFCGDWDWSVSWRSARSCSACENGTAIESLCSFRRKVVRRGGLRSRPTACLGPHLRLREGASSLRS